MKKKLLFGLCLASAMMAFACDETTEPQINEVCQDEQYKCLDNVLKHCMNGVWLDDKICNSNQMCSENEKTCVTDLPLGPICNNGEIFCIDEVAYKFCENGQWMDKICDIGKKCDKSSNLCVGISDVKNDECTQDSYFCSADGALMHCEQGVWKTSQICSGDEVCDAEKGGCIVPECLENAMICMGNTLMQCQSGQNVSIKTCGENERCNASFGKCDMPQVAPETNCTSGTRRCNADLTQVEKCVDGDWTVDTICQQETICDRELKICVPEPNESGSDCSGVETRCDINGSRLLMCENGYWIEKENCDAASGLSCYMREDRVACEQIVCSNGYSCDGNTLRKCENNAYTVTKDCGSEAKCNADAEMCVPNECTNGVYVCSGSTLRKCLDGHWTDSAICTANETCSQDEKKCVANECTNGVYACSGSTLRKCVDGHWTDNAICTANETCSQDAKKCIANECNVNEVRCQDDVLQICVSGKWTASVSCDSRIEKCDAETKSCKAISECASGSRKCSADETTLYTCEDGKWNAGTACDKYMRCDADARACVDKYVCNYNLYYCEGSELINCNNVSGDGKFHVTATCKADQICNASLRRCVDAGAGVVCIGEEYSCDDKTLRVCKRDGSGYDTVRTCSETQTCYSGRTSGSCVEALPAPEWANIQWVEDRLDRGYGRVRLPAGVSDSQISAAIRCGSLSEPVKNWVSQAAVKNDRCLDCGENVVEFVSPGIDVNPGTQSCVFTYAFGVDNYIGTKEGKVIAMNDSTKVTLNDVMTLKINHPDYVEWPSWCKQTYLAAKLDGSGAYYLEGYGQVYPGELNGGQIKAKLWCYSGTTPGNANQYFVYGHENVFCSKETCGENVEYAFKKTPLGNANSTRCMMLIEIGESTYYCPMDDSHSMYKNSASYPSFDPNFVLNIRME